MESQRKENLPLCAKCGKYVPPTNNILTLYRLRGDSCVGRKDCHMDPVQHGLDSCPGGRDLVVRDFQSEELRRLIKCAFFPRHMTNKGVNCYLFCTSKCVAVFLRIKTKDKKRIFI